MLVSQIHLRLLARYIQDDRLVMRKMDAHQRVLIAHCPQAHMGLLLKLFPQPNDLDSFNCFMIRLPL